MTVRTQTRYPGTVVSDDSNGGTVAWADPDKAKVEDNDPATATGPGVSEYLKATGYGFTLPSDAVPLTALPKPRRRGGGAGGAWTVLGSQVLESAAASVSFPGISTTYRMFRVTAYIVKDGTNGQVRLRLNADSGSNYDDQLLRGDNTTVSASRTTSATQLTTGNTITASNVAAIEIVIAKQLAASTAMMLSRMFMGSAQILDSKAGRWNNTADLISRIDLLSSSGNFAAGTTVVLEAM